ncbi:haloacid dehalogenase-like hydrolase domain-containing 5 [Haliotis asinina]|uniref:haloacid dehalogenase-like hydrolase domain-containing 5 n=1 Tax=Haliotis asinina TaxID=109174 RepID=UPI0035319C3A
MACRRWLGSAIMPADRWTNSPPFIGMFHLGKSVIQRRFRHRQASSRSAKFGFLFDIDGVIVRGKKVLPSAKETFSILTDNNGEFRVPCLFVTNAGNTLRQNKAKQLSDWLNVKVHEDQVVMSHSPLKMFRQFHDKHVLVSGQGPVQEIARGLGFTRITTVETLRHTFTNLDMVDHKRRKAAPCAFEQYFPKIDAVILFGEPVRWETNLQIIIDVLLTHGKPGQTQKETLYPHLPVLACNMDLLWMAEAPNPRFGHGCFLHCLESLYQKITGHELKYTALVGKPSEITYHHADYLLSQQSRLLGLDGISTIYCIGDNPETDIYGANLYNRYLRKRLKSKQKRLSAKAVVKQAVAHASGQQVSDMDDDDDDSSEELEMLESQSEGEEFVDNFAKSCESILVCTGVYCSERDFVTYGGKRPSNHNHRDFVIDPDLKRPCHVTQNVLEAVQLVFEKEQFN